MTSSASGWVKISAALGASSSSQSEGSAEPPVAVHSQPSTPSSRGTTAVALMRRRIGKRPSSSTARALPISATARSTAPEGQLHRQAQDARVAQLDAQRAELEQVDLVAAALAGCLELEQELIADRTAGRSGRRRWSAGGHGCCHHLFSSAHGWPSVSPSGRDADPGAAPVTRPRRPPRGRRSCTAPRRRRPPAVSAPRPDRPSARSAGARARAPGCRAAAPSHARGRAR